MESVVVCLLALWYIFGVIWDIYAVTEVRNYRSVDILASLVLGWAGPCMWIYARFIRPYRNIVLFNKRRR